MFIHRPIAQETTDRSLVSRHRPPGSRPNPSFTETCNRCLDCVLVCPLETLHTDKDGYPILTNPKTCGYCGLCADVCMAGAIKLTERTRTGLKMVRAMERRVTSL